MIYSLYCRTNSIYSGIDVHMLSCFCASGTSGREAKDKPGGGTDERTTCSHGERSGEHAGQSSGQLSGAPDHAVKSEGFDFLQKFGDKFACSFNSFKFQLYPIHFPLRCKNFEDLQNLLAFF